MSETPSAKFIDVQLKHAAAVKLASGARAG
jgi:hypothetical protein